VNQQLAFRHMNGSRLSEISDREHAQIRQEEDELRKAILGGLSTEKILEIASDLILTSLLHFESEERTMGASAHAVLVAHRAKHAELVESLRLISLDLNRGNADAAIELVKLFDERLTHHLEVEDAEMERVLAD